MLKNVSISLIFVNPCIKIEYFSMNWLVLIQSRCCLFFHFGLNSSNRPYKFVLYYKKYFSRFRYIVWIHDFYLKWHLHILKSVCKGLIQYSTTRLLYSRLSLCSPCLSIFLSTNLFVWFPVVLFVWFLLVYLFDFCCSICLIFCCSICLIFSCSIFLIFCCSICLISVVLYF